MPIRIENISGGGGGAGNLAVSGGASSGTFTGLTFSNSNGVSFGINNGTITASVAAGASGGVALSLSGNTAGVLGLISTGTAIIAGGNNITVSQNGQSVTISGPNTVAQSNQTVGLYASSNTYLTSSGTADARSLSFRGDKSITIGVSAGEVVFSVGAYLTTAMGSGASTQFVQANAVFNGTNATGTIASNAISVSVAAPIPIATAVKPVASIGSTGTITRYAPEDHQHAGVAAFAITNTGNTAGNTRSQVGTLYMAASGGITASQSTGAAGNDTIWLSVASPVAQTTQSAIKAFGVSNTGNTAGNTGVSTGIDWVLAASNSLTLSQSTTAGGPDTVWVQVGAYITTADLSANSSKYVQNWKLTGNTAGTTSSAQSTDLWLQGGNSITVSGSSNTVVFSVGNYITTADLSQNTSKFVQNWKLTGNTAGTTSSAQGTDLWLQGGNSITVSGSSNTIVLSVGAYITTADLSANSSKYVQNWKLTGNTAGTTSSAQGTDLWFSGGNSITVSGNSNTIVFSVGAYITTAALSGDTSKYIQAWELTGNTAGTTSSLQGTKLYLAGGNGITLSGNSNTITISAFTQTIQSAIRGLGVSNTGSTSGNTGISTGIDWVIAGSGNITASESTTAGGPNTIWLSVATAAAAPVNFSAGTTSSNIGSVVFSNSNGIAFGLSGSTITASASRGFYATGNTTDNTSASYDIRSVTLNAQNASGCLTIGFSNGSIEFSGASTVGTATTVTPVASANSVGTITRWAAEDHRHAGVGGIGISTSGNTTGTTGSEVGTYWFQGGNSITLSQITSNNGSHTLVISGPSSAMYSHFFEPFYMLDGSATSTGSLSQLGVQPFTLPARLSFGGLNMVGQGTVVPTSGSHNWSIRLTNSTQAFQFSAQYSISNYNLVDFYLFSRGTGVFSSELETFASTRNSFVTFYQVTQLHSATLTNTAGGSIKVSQSFSMSISYPFMTSSSFTSINAGSSYTRWGTGYTTWTSTASNSTSDTYSTSVAKAIAVGSTYPATVGWSGTKLLYFNFGSSLTPGEYWLGVVRYSSQDSASATGTSVTGTLGTGASYSYTYNATDLKQTQMLTYMGKTNSIANSLGLFGFVTTANMGPEFGLGTFSGTWDTGHTYLNNLANPNGAIGPSQLLTGVSFFQSWFQMNSNRGGC